MKRTILKVVAVLLALAVVFPAFAGGTKEPVKQSGPVTIDLWYGAAVTEAGAPPADWFVIQEVKEKLNIDLKVTALPSSPTDQDVKINAAGAGNSLPDLFMVNRPILLKLIDQGLVAEVDSMYAMMPERTKTHYDAASIQHTTVDGHSYGLADPGAVSGNEGVLIRKDWLDKLGLSVPKTTDDFMKVMKAFTYNDPDGNGKNDTYGFGAFLEINALEGGLGRRLEPIMSAFGVSGTWSMDKKTAGLNVLRPEYFEALTYVKAMCDEGVIDPNWLAYKKDDFRAAWKQGRFGIMREQNAAFAAQNNYKPFDDNFPNGEWIVIDPPVGPKGDSAVGPRDQGYRIYAVSQKAADAGKIPAIASLLEWMATDGFYKLGWGVEGVNFVLDADGIPVVDGIAKENQWSEGNNITLTQLRNMVFVNSDIELAARYPTYVCSNSGKTMSALTVLREMQAKDWVTCTGGGAMPTPNADLKRFWEQGILEFLTGKRSLTKANWDAWVAEFKAMGGEDWNNAGLEYAKANALLY